MPDVFVKRQTKIQPGFNVAAVLRRKQIDGDIGIEVEVEGTKLPKEAHTPPPWAYHVDGSLRGQDNAEYVLQSPIKFDKVPAALDKLWAAFEAKGSTFDESNRTSIHVHLNCQSFHWNRLASFIALYFAFEDILTEWCGEHRVGNLFCLRAKDAPAVVTQIKRFIQTDGRYELRDHLHYSAMNANALHKFGSLEIRTMRGVSDKKVIIDWVNALRRLYDLSADFPDPREICSLFSGFGPMAFFSHVLGDSTQIIRSGVNMTDDKICESMYEGIRMAQDICYCRDWSVFKAIDIKEDPFGRSMNKVMKKIATMTVGEESSPVQYDPFPQQPIYGESLPTIDEYEPDYDYD